MNYPDFILSKPLDYQNKTSRLDEHVVHNSSSSHGCIYTFIINTLQNFLFCIECSRTIARFLTKALLKF